VSNVIKQRCGRAETEEDYQNWLVGQQATAEYTKLEYSFYEPDTKQITAFYRLSHSKTDLKRGQKGVISHV
jgi:hypothetical protein